MSIKPTHITTDKATGTKNVLVEYDERNKEYKENDLISLIEAAWDFNPIIKTKGK